MWEKPRQPPTCGRWFDADTMLPCGGLSDLWNHKIQQKTVLEYTNNTKPFPTTTSSSGPKDFFSSYFMLVNTKHSDTWNTYVILSTVTVLAILYSHRYVCDAEPGLYVFLLAFQDLTKALLPSMQQPVKCIRCTMIFSLPDFAVRNIVNFSETLQFWPSACNQSCTLQ